MLTDIRVSLMDLIPAAPASTAILQTSVLVVGGGAAGLAAALRAAEHTDVLLLTRAVLPTGNSAWAQGGIAAALDPADSPAAHVADTLVAGAGLSDVAAVEVLAADAPNLMRELAALGVPLEQENGHLALGLEGGHSRRRIVHAGDATGYALVSTLARYVLAHPRITVLAGYHVAELRQHAGRVTGVVALDAHGTWCTIEANATILATGGAGALFGLTSNHADALGEGIALAYRAGAEVADMEFVQFHPTVFKTRDGSGFLLTEALRGEGATLYDINGARFMPAYDERAELAPRDVVSRGIFAAMRASSSDYVLLDVTHKDAAYLAQRFPTIVARLYEEGYDLATQRVPVAPAAHYLMGGVRTDLRGATSLLGLYAAGEVACTGVHGANRLASNSLLECLVFGRRAADAAVADAQNLETAEPPNHSAVPPQHAAAQLPTTDHRPPMTWRPALTAIMHHDVGLIRDADGLQRALHALAALPLPAPDTSDGVAAANACLVAQLIATGALLREESRGGHTRSDFPATEPRWQTHIIQQRDSPPHTADVLAELGLVAA